MHIGLNLVGELGLDSREDWIDEMETWFRRQCAGSLVRAQTAKDVLGRPYLHMALHPLAPVTRLTSLGRGRIQLTTDTGPVGPGYHAWVCRLAQKMALAFDVTWDRPTRGTSDSTGYFEHGDEVALYRAVLEWTRELATATLVELQTMAGSAKFLLPEDTDYVHARRVATPMGPRDIGWLEIVAKQPAHAIPAFPWWDLNDEAKTALGRAIGQMWTEVRWREPIHEEERGLMVEVSHLLETASTSSAAWAIPWREWEEILQYLGEAGPLVERVADEASRVNGPLIGYRRNPVRRTLLDGWSVQIPGSFAERFEDAATWVAWDEGRTIWFSSFANRTGEVPQVPMTASSSFGEIMEYQTERVRGSAVLDLGFEDKQAVWQLSTRSAIGNHLAICTICYTDQADRRWAMDVWRSLQHNTVEVTPAVESGEDLESLFRRYA